MEEITKKCGVIRSYFDGFANLFSYSNLYQGRDSLGDKIIHLTNNSRILNKPVAFASGYFTELATEIVVPIYIASSSDSIRWYHVLLADLVIKTIPRGLERILNWGKPKIDKEITSN